jgi:HK97 family phage prohead protease
METLTDNLSRMRPFADAAEVRAAGEGEGDGRTLFGHFSVFDTFYEVDSSWEGNFLEQIAPGAFARTIAERGGQVKALYDHGHDPQLGNKPLGPFTELHEDSRGGYYEIGLIDTDYNRDFIIPAAAAGLLGASFRFKVRAEAWVDEPEPSAANPRGIPERTITDVDLYELGPVTFPASEAATAALRSTSDEFFGRLLDDPLFVARFTERAGVTVVEKMLATLPADGRSVTPQGSADGHPSTTDVDTPSPPDPYTPAQRPVMTRDRIREDLRRVTAMAAAASAQEAHGSWN